MKNRCLNPKQDNYPLGGAGVMICERWLTFAHFLADMGEKPTRHDRSGSESKTQLRALERQLPVGDGAGSKSQQTQRSEAIYAPQIG